LYIIINTPNNNDYVKTPFEILHKQKLSAMKKNRKNKTVKECKSYFYNNITKIRNSLSNMMDNSDDKKK